MHPTIHYLKNKRLLWQANHTESATVSVHKTGFAELDQALQGGFPEYGIVDIRSPLGIGELRLLLPNLLARHQTRTRDLCIFIEPPLQPNSEMLAEFGFDLDKILILQNHDPKLTLWSAEQSLKSGCCHSIVVWLNALTVKHVKRLQLAAEKGNCVLFMLRPPQLSHISLPVTLGLTLIPNQTGIQVNITKRRGSPYPQPIYVNMATYWPELSRHTPSHIIPFPTPLHNAG